MKTWREHIMNINWKVRLKSGPFWLGVASAVIMAVFYILDLCGAAPEITGSQIIEAVRLLLKLTMIVSAVATVLTGLGYLLCSKRQRS